MDSQSIYDELPWELIVSALQGELSPDEDLRFREWLAQSADNWQKYDQLLQIWKEEMADYVFYRAANPAKAWEALQQRIEPRIALRNLPRIPLARRLAAIAAILVLIIGAGWWWLSGRNTPVQFATTVNEEKKVSLPDGSTVVLSPQTTIRLAGGYNKSGRTVILTGGEARFDVSHQEQLPFVVDMDAASIKDIGTSFTVQKTKDSIQVIVSSGKIAFISKGSSKGKRESREISAGGSLCFYVAEQRFGELKTTNPEGSLRFDNTSLSDIITALQKYSGNRILLSDTAIGQKRLTVHLDGESFDNALKIICASLNLEYTGENGVYILKTRDTATHN